MNPPELGEGLQFRERMGIRWLESRVGEHRVLFSLRSSDRTGSDGTPLDLDMGRTTTGPTTAQLAARRMFCEAVGIDPASVRIARQVHGDRILDLEGPEGELDGVVSLVDSEPPAVEADGFLLSERSMFDGPPAIVTADCLPVAIDGPRGIALLHLGWRGLATGLLEDAVRRTEGVNAVIGPAIGPCCYEVGREVFGSLGLERNTERAPLDLVAVVTDRLSRANVDRVVASGLCTACEQDLLFSHRRDGEATGRQLTTILPGSPGSS
jgi:copper oxidase (laccase) domain-containing protein